MTHEHAPRDINERRALTSCTYGFCIQDVYQMIMECPKHKDEMCSITDMYKSYLPSG